MKFLIILSFTLSGCLFIENVQRNILKQNEIEGAALNLARENRELRGRVVQVEAELKKTPSDLNRTIAQKFKYEKIGENWKADEILFVAEIEYEREDFQKSSFFFKTLLRDFPNHQIVTDQVLFKAGRAFYQEGKNYNLARDVFTRIISEFPNSFFYLQSKLWLTIIFKKLGQEKKFKEGILEFKEKYQNTQEWKILEKHYEKIIKI